MISKVKIIKSANSDYPFNAQIWTSNDNGKSFNYVGNGKFFKTYKQALDYKKEIESLSVKVGTVIHSNDKYFFGSDGYDKNRESVVVATNGKKVALSKLTTSKNEKYKFVPNYNNISKYISQNLYTKDNELKDIYISDKNYIDKFNKFIISSFSMISEDSVKEILSVILSDPIYGERNKKRLKQFLEKK